MMMMMMMMCYCMFVLELVFNSYKLDLQIHFDCRPSRSCFEKTRVVQWKVLH